MPAVWLSRRALLGATASVGLVGLAGCTARPVTTPPGAGPTPPGASATPLPVIADAGKLAIPRDVVATRVTTIGVEPLLADRGGAVLGVTPSNLDGMGAFDVPGGVRLVRNHECRADARVPVPLAEGTVYDAGVPTGMGGNTVVETTPDGTFVQQWVALSGTIRNCAGGETPWGSWLSCEEDLTKAGTKVRNGAGVEYTTEQDHGYVFEVFPDAVARQCPKPVKAWGRALWEGAAIGPRRTDAYLTEDTVGGLFYRWVAPEGTVIGPRIAEQYGAADGVLQAAQLVRDGKALVHYGELTASDLDKPYPVTWLDGGADRQARQSDLRTQYPGATVHPKIEGCWSDGRGLWIALSYVSASEAADHGIDPDNGMLVLYDFGARTLTLKAHYPVGGEFDGPDNVTVSPWGTIVMAEDGSDPNHLIGWTPRGGSRPLARDLGKRGEWAGPCFNDSGSVLFASVQSDCTYAFTGPMGPLLGR